MMRSARALVAVGMVLGLAASLQAGDPNSWWGRYWIDYHRNHCWPDPFVAPDRAAVKAPFLIMADNGWRRQNLLCEYHFSDGNETLNQAGEHRLLWILTQAPVNRRAVFVQRGANGNITAARVDAVEQAVVKLVPSGPLPQVYESNLDVIGYPGEDADATLRAAEKSRPDPRLPSSTPGSISSSTN